MNFELTCPYCQTEQDSAWVDEPGDDFDRQCPNCGKHFRASVEEVLVFYSETEEDYLSRMIKNREMNKNNPHSMNFNNYLITEAEENCEENKRI